MELKFNVRTENDDVLEPYMEVNLLEEIKISNFKILFPNKVIRVDFSDNTQEKVVCDDKDKFDLRRGLFIALSKKMYKDKYTLEGIEHMATELSYHKKYVKMVDKAIKDHDKKLIEAENKKCEEALQKKLAYERKVKRDKKKRERAINIQKEAYVRAMNEYGTIKSAKRVDRLTNASYDDAARRANERIEKNNREYAAAYKRAALFSAK